MHQCNIVRDAEYRSGPQIWQSQNKGVHDRWPGRTGGFEFKGELLPAVDLILILPLHTLMVQLCSGYSLLLDIGFKYDTLNVCTIYAMHLMQR